MSKGDRKRIPTHLFLEKVIHITRHNRTAPYLPNKRTTFHLPNLTSINQLLDFGGNRRKAVLETHHVPHTVEFDQVCQLFGFSVVGFDRPFNVDVFSCLDSRD